MNIIELKDVHKRFNRLDVLKGASFSVEEGEIFGLIGENGAGKTTTTKIILGLEHPQKGSATMFGECCSKDIVARKRKYAFVSETVFPPDFLSVEELLSFHRKFYPTWDRDLSESLLKFFNLDRKAKVADLSRGQKARLKLIMAFSYRPSLILIDEITAGLDAAVRHDLLAQLKEMIAKGDCTIMITSNLLYDLEVIATKIALIEDGQIAFSKKVDEIVSAFVKLTFKNPEAADIATPDLAMDSFFDRNGYNLILEASQTDKLLADPQIAAFNPMISHLDLEKTFVYHVKARKKGAS